MGTIRKFLIIRLSSLGDVILASPLIRVLRAAYPDGQIDFLVKSEYVDLVRFNPHLSSIVELQTGEKAEVQLLKKAIRRTRYDVVLDIHNSLRSRYLRLCSGAGSTRVVDKRVVKRFFHVQFQWNFYRTIIPVVDRYIETALPLGVKNDRQGLEIFFPDEVVLSVKTAMDKFKLDRYKIIVGIAPSARHETKRWPADRYIDFGVRLTKSSNAKVLILGSKEEQDYCGDIAQIMNARAESPVAENVAGKFTLLETAALLDVCDLVVTNDSGMMHLAAARKKKIVAVFGSTVKEFGFYPYGTEHIVLQREGLSCRPCSHVGLDACPRKHFRCMNDIEVAEVLNAAKTLLAG